MTPGVHLTYSEALASAKLRKASRLPVKSESHVRAAATRKANLRAADPIMAEARNGQR